MGRHKYKITVDYIENTKGVAMDVAPLVFQVENHDDIMALAARTGAATDKDLAFLMGLKLLGETLLDDKDNPLYAEFKEHFGTFMKRLKQSRTKPQE